MVWSVKSVKKRTIKSVKEKLGVIVNTEKLQRPVEEFPCEFCEFSVTCGEKGLMDMINHIIIEHPNDT